jgi:hypothetical protein
VLEISKSLDKENIAGSTVATVAGRGCWLYVLLGTLEPTIQKPK